MEDDLVPRRPPPARTTLDEAWHVGPLGPIRLRVVGPDGAALTLRLAPGEAVEIGRDAAVGARVSEPSVSGRHARVEHRGGAIRVVDLGSRNGVRIGGARVSEADVELGEIVRLGRLEVAAVEHHGEPALRGGPLPLLLGRSRPMLRLADEVRRVAPLRLPALVRGESGTGKDLVARAIHAESPRRAGPFVAINAAAIARDLAESELFGHLRGAFTGAMRERRGAFREAHGGTLLIDEIAALAPELQAKLLRVVEDGVVRPLGGEAQRPVDVRLVAATCEPLEAMVARRAFRADLFERLAACVISVPPLRDRPEDLPELARHVLAESGLGAVALRSSALRLLQREAFPGNVRELRNVVVQAALASSGPWVDASHVAAALAARRGRAARPTPAEARRLLGEAGGNVSEAARRAGLARSSLRDLAARAPRAH